MQNDPNSWYQGPPPPLRLYDPNPKKKFPLWLLFFIPGMLLVCIYSFSVLFANHSTPQTPSQMKQIQNSDISTPTNIPKPTPIPTRISPAATPKQTPTPKPTPTIIDPPTIIEQPTTPPQVSQHPAQSNPVYNTDPNGGNLVYNPPSNFCYSHSCVSTFWTKTAGYVVECVNGKWSHSGGVAGACSRDGGESGVDLFQH